MAETTTTSDLLASIVSSSVPSEGTTATSTPDSGNIEIRSVDSESLSASASSGR